MKKLNFNIYLTILLAVLMVTACKKDDDLKLNEPSHRVIFTSEMDFLNTIEVNGAISFGDVSAGVESRTWTFPAGVVDIEGSDNDVTSTEANVKAYFPQVGEFDVQLNQVFKSDAYVDETLRGKVLDTTIVVTVLDSIVATMEAFYLNEDGTLGDPLVLADNAENEIPAAEYIRYTFTGTGSPRNINWELEGGTPGNLNSSDFTIDVQYKFLGTFDFSMTPFRSRPFGRDTLAFKNLIKVIPSTKPVLVEQVTDREGDIAVVFGREINPTTITSSDFEVSIKTDNGDLIVPSFSSVGLDPDEGNVVRIKLAGEAIYNDDSIKVSYNPGTLVSLDGVDVTGFTEELLRFNLVNILKENSNYDWSFETSSEDHWKYLGWGAPYDKYIIDMTFDQAYEGFKSMYVSMENNGGMIVSLIDNDGNDVTFPGSAGKTYELGAWVYVEELGDPTIGLAPDLRLYWGPDTNWGLGPNPEFNVSFPVGEWIYSSIFMEFSETGPKNFLIRGFNGSNPMPMSFYVDNLVLAEVNLRP